MGYSHLQSSKALPEILGSETMSTVAFFFFHREISYRLSNWNGN